MSMPRARFVQGDVSDPLIVMRLIAEHRIRAIVHFAAKIVVPDSVADPLDYYLANTVKTRALLASVAAAHVPHFVFSSTAAVYGDDDRQTLGWQPKFDNLETPAMSGLVSGACFADFGHDVWSASTRMPPRSSG
jgi:UDP-glucose 4-epimerase